ncbi:MAG: replication restart helicase PriA [Planctomycetota bacterium]|jgi:primosomal protein N' (replication factor Y)
MSRYKTDSLFADVDSRSHGNDKQGGCSHIIRVSFESAADAKFDYAVPDELWPIEAGRRVEVPFGRKDKLEVGCCVEADIPPDQSFTARGGGRKLKRIVKLMDKEPLLDSQLMELARWISGYYVCPLGQVLAAMVPGAVKRGAGVKRQKYVYLAEGVDEVIEQLRGKKQKQIVEYLHGRGALNSKNALELQGVLETIGCGKEPVKRLAEKQIVKIVQRTILKSLPAIPKGMSIKTEKIVLNEDQRKALARIKDEINSGKFGVTLLHGVTDSGKTELYMRAIEAVLQKGASAIVLLPEIALTAQTVQRFNERFKKIAVMHSGLTAAQRNVQWQKIKAGEADVVIGARSAVFAPVPALGLIVIDEEHEPSYKQDTAPRYNGRDVAVKRAQLADAHCILGSATPSLEMLSNCRAKKHFSLLRLPKRVMDLPMPEMKLVDLRQEPVTQKGISLISEPLSERLKETIAKKEQAILLLNRRGYSNFVFCPSCKHTLHCRNCDVTLTFHKSKALSTDRMRTVTGKHINYGYAVCHYCLAQTLVPAKCPLCGKGMAMIGLGSQRLEEELAKKFPHVRVSRVDSDSMASRDYYRLLRDFSEGRIDILAGTQMLAKGLHFPNVTLVGIISADTCLYLPDFRANERTFQLISQVAGRAGRSVKKGTVFVQTFLPDQPAIQFALGGDFDGFVKEELTHRKACNLPPFWRLAVIVMRDMSFDKLDAASRQMRQIIDLIVEREGLKATVRGPMPAVISRIQRFHRMQIIIQAPEARTVQQLFASLRSRLWRVRPTVKVVIDIDPVNLL